MKLSLYLTKKLLLSALIVSLGFVQIFSTKALSFIYHDDIEDRIKRLEYFNYYFERSENYENKYVSNGIVSSPYSLFSPLSEDIGSYEFFRFENLYHSYKPAVGSTVFTYRDRQNTHKKLTITVNQYPDRDIAIQEYEYTKFDENLKIEASNDTSSLQCGQYSPQMISCKFMYENLVIKIDHNALHEINNIDIKYLLKDIVIFAETLTKRAQKLTVVANQQVENHPFTDVTKWTAMEEALNYFYQKELINGYKDETFRPNTPINRAEATKILILALELPLTDYQDSFTDVDKQSWYMPYIETAKEHEFIVGYPDGTFLPERLITKSEFTALTEDYFSEIRFWEKESLETIYHHSIEFSWPETLNGIGKEISNYMPKDMPIQTFEPNKPITRGEFVLQLYMAMSRDCGNCF